jgi:hypothetical protein
MGGLVMSALLRRRSRIPRRRKRAPADCRANKPTLLPRIFQSSIELVIQASLSGDISYSNISHRVALADAPRD